MAYKTRLLYAVKAFAAGVLEQASLSTSTIVNLNSRFSIIADTTLLDYSIITLLGSDLANAFLQYAI